MSAQQYLSYTYLIGWTEHDTWYYGVRTANKHKPENDLWIHYFTSSKYVQEFRELHGDPDVIQIDKTFENQQDALTFESEQLKKFDVINESKWLNKAISNKIKCIRKGSENGFYGKTHSDEQKAKWSKIRSGRKLSDEHKQKVSLAISGKNNPFYGKKHSAESKKLMSEKAKIRSSGENNVMYGKKHSDKTKKLMSEKAKGRGRKPVEIDGKIFESHKAAAEALGISNWKVGEMVRKGEAKNRSQ